MKYFQIITPLFISLNICGAQPSLTLWITADGYHAAHEHHAMSEYFCDSSYYLLYQSHADTLSIAIKNEGTEPLELFSASAQSAVGALFQVVDFHPQQLTPGAMYTIKLFYQLPSSYVSGINGQLQLTSNDPQKKSCTLHFDVGCGASWKTTVVDTMGIDGTCDNPVIWIADGNFLSGPSMVYDDSMTFYNNLSPSFSQKVMKLDHKGGVLIPNFQIVGERLEAGSRPGNSSNFRADSFRVQIQKDLDVKGTATIDGFLDVRANANIVGHLDVFDDMIVRGIFEVNHVVTPSDRRKKKEIIDLQAALPKIMELQPKTYYLKDPTKSNQRQFGFIAQELESTIPEIVHTSDDDMKAVNYMQIIPWLTAALQEQQDIINQLQHRIDHLEAK